MIFFVAAASAATSVFAAKGPVFDAQRMSRDVRHISADEFEGRAPNSAGETMTVDFIVEQFKAAGLKPGGDMVKGKRVWTQDVPLGRFDISGPVSLGFTDGKATLALRQGEDVAVRASMTGERQVDFSRAPLVFVGYGVSAPERTWDDFKGQDLKGKLAIVLINDPDFETGQGDFGGKAMTYYGRWTYKFEEMARRGALGTLIVHETGPASYGWATVKNSNTNTMYDIVRKDPKTEHASVEAWVQRDIAVDMFKRAGLDFEALKKSAQTRQFKPMELKGVTMSANYAVDAKVIVSKNVVAIKPGKSKPLEHVIYSAHWDHLGVGLPDARGDKIYNGAGDNATGIAALLELGRAFGRAPAPRRSAVFIAFTAEEKGLMGSEYYASNPLYPLGLAVGVINMDNLTPKGLTKNFTISGSAKLDLLDRMVTRARQWDLSFSPETQPEAGRFFRSDHFPMAKKGVPAVSFKSGDDWVDGGTAAGRQYQVSYVANSYHQPSDEWREDWTFAGTARDLELLYAVGSELANSRDWPNWSQDSEFRAVRDASAAERK
jgi:Zn-dependent M28 family amino/carboxypeptidase